MTNPVDKERQSFRSRLGLLFTYGGPIESRDLLAGRTKELQKIDDALQDASPQIVIHGGAAVGKSSLARSAIGQRSLLAPYSCSATDTFFDIFGQVFADLEELRTVQVQTTSTESDEKTGHFPQIADITRESVIEDEVHREPWHTSGITPAVVTRMFQNHPEIDVVIIDEYDLVSDINTHRLMCETLKSFSDNHLKTRLIIVGVGESIASLFRDAVIPRALCVVGLDKLTKEGLLELIETREKLLDVTFLADVKTAIVELSDGLAYFTHHLCLAASIEALPRLMLRRDRIFHRQAFLEVTIADLQKGAHRVLEHHRDFPGKLFELAAESRAPADNRLYARVLRACARCPYPWFTKDDVVDELRKANARQDIRSINEILENLCGPERARILDRHEFLPRFRFTNALLPGYARIQAFVDRHS